MRRGEIYTAATGGGFGGKPRPVLIVQADLFAEIGKKLVVLIGSPVDGASPIRVPVEPDVANNLKLPSEVMIDSILPVRPEKFGTHIGYLSDADMKRVEIAMMTFLGSGLPA